MKLITSPEEITLAADVLAAETDMQTESTESKLREIARKVGLDAETALAESEESLKAAAREAGIESRDSLLMGVTAGDSEDEVSDPSDAGNIADGDETTGEDVFDPSAAGKNQAQEAAPETAAEDSFDPAAAGSVQAQEAVQETPKEDGFDPAAAGNTRTPEAVPEIPAETFDPSQAGQVETPVTPAENPGNIRITSEYTYTDPADLAYDMRYVFHKEGSGEPASILTAGKNAEVSDVYIIFYVKDGKVLTEYRCFVMNGTVICEETKQEDLADLIGSLPGMEKAYEASPEGYQDFIKEVYQLEEVKEGDR